MNLVHGLVSQYDVVRLLVLRETRTQHSESRLGYALALLDPLLWVMMFFFAFSWGGKEIHHGMDVLPYLATGVCCFKTFQSVSSSPPVKLPHRLLALRQITVLDIFLAKATLKAATMGIVFLLLVGGSVLFTGKLEQVDEPLEVVGGMLLAVFLGFGFGLLLTAGQRLTKLVVTIRTLLNRLMFWSSGMFFVAEDLPQAARDIALLNPVLHAVELVRGGWFPSYDATYANPTYALVCAATLTLAGLTCEQLTRGRE